MKDNWQPESAPARETPPWAITFSDMALNMLCIFALLLSFSKFRTDEFKIVAGSVKAALGVSTSISPESTARAAHPDVPASDQQDQDESPAVDATSAAAVTRFMRDRGWSTAVEVDDSPRGVVLRVRDRALFDSGSAEVRTDAAPLLGAVEELVRAFPGTLAIEGHTDDRAISTSQFPSNWELSAARAASVLRQLTADGVPVAGLHVAGYAAMRPVASNEDEAGRARNRRVEFVFERR